MEGRKRVLTAHAGRDSTTGKCGGLRYMGRFRRGADFYVGRRRAGGRTTDLATLGPAFLARAAALTGAFASTVTVVGAQQARLGTGCGRLLGCGADLHVARCGAGSRTADFASPSPTLFTGTAALTGTFAGTGAVVGAQQAGLGARGVGRRVGRVGSLGSLTLVDIAGR